MTPDLPNEIQLDWQAQYRIVSSRFPPINFFEDLVDPARMEALYAIESMTNDRLRDQAGDISLVKPKDRVSGPNASVVMAAFTHISKDRPTRFSDGTFGLYYAGARIETAIAETIYHRERFMKATQQPPAELDMRVYKGKVLKPFYDIRGKQYNGLHDPDDYSLSQQFGRKALDANGWGIVYRSVRDPGGECIGALRPPAISLPVQSSHLCYVWDGRKIAYHYVKTGLAKH